MHVAVINITTKPVSVKFVGDDDILWAGGVPSDGTPRTKEDFIPLWLTVTANMWSGFVIVGSIFHITFTCIFRKRKYMILCVMHVSHSGKALCTCCIQIGATHQSKSKLHHCYWYNHIQHWRDVVCQSTSPYWNTGSLLFRKLLVNPLISCFQIHVYRYVHG